MSPLVEATPPSNYEEVLGTNLWWTNHFFGNNFGTSPVRASFFARRGISQVGDIRNPANQTNLSMGGYT